MRDPERTKESILQAAERVIVAKGIKDLTLEEVAAGAAVSKGGLLHHFASKQALVDGLAARMIREHEQAVEEYRKEDPATPGSYTRAFLRTKMAFADECTQVCATLAADSRNFPAMREMFREYATECQRKCENDGLDPVAATVVWLAAEGLISAAINGMPRPSNLEGVAKYLLNLAGRPT